MGKFSKEIRAYALKNAIEFGRADAGKILPKLFQHGLEKSEIKEVMPEITQIVDEVNALSPAERASEFEQLHEHVKEREEKERVLPELPNVVRDMVFRLAPFPSGALHIGNAKTYLLNALYAEKYNAKTILVFDDTIGSEEKQVMPEAYELIQDAFSWLGVKYDEVAYKSDRLNIYYEYAEKLIDKDKAYACTCDVTTLRANREKGKECKCRNLKYEDQIKRWKEMFRAKEGSMTLRLKTDMLHPNPAFRDRVLFKISDRKHPRVGNKYRVWPTLEMSWAIDDILLGITHIIRGNDLLMETDMEKYIWDIFGWAHPQTIHVGLVRIEGTEAKISKSKAQKEVKSGVFTGWDDLRTWSMQSLRRRGIRKEAIKEFVKDIGLNKQNINIPIESLYSINRKMIDMESNRYSFVKEPFELNVVNAPSIEEVEVPVHPDREERRKIRMRKIFISKNDFDALKGKEVRLIHLYNISLDEKSGFISMDNENIPKINWVSEGVKARILMPDGKWVEGLAEEAIEHIKEDEVIQFERFGFCRLDGPGKNGEYEFWFAHR